MTYPGNEICLHLDDFSCVDDRITDNNIEDQLQVEESSTSSFLLKPHPCCVCFENASQIMTYPCGHVNVCSDCWATLVDSYNNKLKKFNERHLGEEYRPQLRCPFCHAIVANY